MLVRTQTERYYSLSLFFSWKMQFGVLRLCFIQKLILFLPPPLTQGKNKAVRSRLKPIGTLSLDDSSCEGHRTKVFRKARSSSTSSSATIQQKLFQSSHLMRISTIKTSQPGKVWEASRVLPASWLQGHLELHGPAGTFRSNHCRAIRPFLHLVFNS